jgi:hypothetical protein
MNIKRYKLTHRACPIETPNGEMVKYSDYKHLSDYCDHLVEFSKLPCLPKDLEVLREANHLFAIECAKLEDKIKELEAYMENSIKGWENKWRVAVDMAARAEIQRDDALKDCERLYEKLSVMQTKLHELLNS